MPYFPLDPAPRFTDTADLTSRSPVNTARPLGNPSSACRPADALYRARLASQAEEELAELRSELERERWQRRLLACELHDSVAQELAAAHMLLETLNDPVTPEQDQERRRQVRSCVQTALEQVRAMLAASEPPHNAPRHSWAELARWVRQWQANERFLVELHGLADLPSVAPPISSAILRIVQEALRNARRHSGAAGAVVSLASDHGRLRVEIRDAGSGLVPRVLPPASFGLHSIRTRAEASGGRAQVLATPGTGTSIVVEWPLVPETAAATENLP